MDAPREEREGSTRTSSSCRPVTLEHNAKSISPSDATPCMRSICGTSKSGRPSSSARRSYEVASGSGAAGATSSAPGAAGAVAGRGGGTAAAAEAAAGATGEAARAGLVCASQPSRVSTASLPLATAALWRTYSGGGATAAMASMRSASASTPCGTSSWPSPSVVTGTRPDSPPSPSSGAPLEGTDGCGGGVSRVPCAPCVPSRAAASGGAVSASRALPARESVAKLERRTSPAALPGTEPGDTPPDDDAPGGAGDSLADAVAGAVGCMWRARRRTYGAPRLYAPPFILHSRTTPRITSPTVADPSICVTCHTRPSSTTSLSTPLEYMPPSPPCEPPCRAGCRLLPPSPAAVGEACAGTAAAASPAAAAAAAVALPSGGRGGFPTDIDPVVAARPPAAVGDNRCADDGRVGGTTVPVVGATAAASGGCATWVAPTPSLPPAAVVAPSVAA